MTPCDGRRDGSGQPTLAVASIALRLANPCERVWEPDANGSDRLKGPLGGAGRLGARVGRTRPPGGAGSSPAAAAESAALPAPWLPQLARTPSGAFPPMRGDDAR